MDAAQTIIKKTAFFLATALLLTAPFQASAQPTLAANSYSVAIGSSSCNDSQTINLTSSGASIPFTVSVNYPNGTSNGDDNGAWLYAGDQAVVHLVELSEAKKPSSEAALDHFAFAIDDYDDVVRRLEKAGHRFQAIEVPNAPIRQIFIRDLNGVNIELNYRTKPAA